MSSAVPEEGKTTVATNLAHVLTQSGEQVILVDADLRRPQVADRLGLNPSIGLTNVLLETTHLDDALQSSPRLPGLQVLTSGPIPPNPSELLGSQRMRDVLTALQGRSTIVVFDAPPLLPVTDAAELGAILMARCSSSGPARPGARRWHRVPTRCERSLAPFLVLCSTAPRLEAATSATGRAAISRRGRLPPSARTRAQTRQLEWALPKLGG